MLGTFVEISIADGNPAIIEPAFDAVSHVHAVMSFHDDASDLGRLRSAPPGRGIRVDPLTVEVLRLARELRAKSGGLFDVTIGGVLVADGFLPCPPGIDLRRFDGTADDIEIIDDEHVICHRALLIDLGGIAKGFAVDRASNSLREAGAGSAIVNAGGDLRVVGTTPHTIHLRAADGSIDGAVSLADGALASSSNRHLQRMVGRRRVVPHRGHGGAPVPCDHAVTVVAPSCALADAVTKIALIDHGLASAILFEAGGTIVERVPPPPANVYHVG